jgi:hypothetical protein
MAYQDADERGWDIPLGPVGVGAMAVLGGVAFTLGEFDFYGLEFLPYWYLIGGWSVGLAVFAAAWGTLLECLIWNGRLGPTSRFLVSWHSTHRAVLAAGILITLAATCWYAHEHYQCLLLGAPMLGLVVFAIATTLQEPILRTLRDAQGRGAAWRHCSFSKRQ